jgi:hypothetical protein
MRTSLKRDVVIVWRLMIGLGLAHRIVVHAIGTILVAAMEFATVAATPAAGRAFEGVFAPTKPNPGSRYVRAAAKAARQQIERQTLRALARRPDDGAHGAPPAIALAEWIVGFVGHERAFRDRHFRRPSTGFQSYYYLVAIR